MNSLLKMGIFHCHVSLPEGRNAEVYVYHAWECLKIRSPYLIGLTTKLKLNSIISRINFGYTCTSLWEIPGSPFDAVTGLSFETSVKAPFGTDPKGQCPEAKQKEVEGPAWDATDTTSRWLNHPVEKYARQNGGIFPKGWKWNIFELPPPRQHVHPSPSRPVIFWEWLVCPINSELRIEKQVHHSQEVSQDP